MTTYVLACISGRVRHPARDRVYDQVHDCVQETVRGRIYTPMTVLLLDLALDNLWFLVRAEGDR